jgi:hypothetical protein
MGFFLGIILLLCPTFAFADSLPSESLAALEAAQADLSTSISILRRHAHTEREEWVVLLGESHVKNAESSALAKTVLQTFPGDVGIESVVNIDKYAGGQMLKNVSMPLILGVGKLVGFNQQSSAYDAPKIAKDRGKQVVFLEKGHQPDLLEHIFVLHVNTSVAFTVVTNSVRVTNGVYRFGRMVRDEGVVASAGHVWRWSIQVPGRVGRWTVSTVVNSGRAVKNTCLLPITLYQKGWEQCAADVSSWFRAQMQTPTLGIPTYQGTKRFTEKALLANAVALIGLSIYSSRSPVHHWGIFENRNETMVENLVSHIDDPANPGSMLAIAGAGHRPGIVRMLEARGFELVSLDDLQKEIAEERAQKPPTVIRRPDDAPAQ